MSHHPSRPQYRQRTTRHSAQGNKKRVRPLVWMIVGIVIILVVLLIAGGITIISKLTPPTPTPTSVPTATATVRLTPTLTFTPTTPPYPTDIPRKCVITINGDMYALPDFNSVSEPLTAGESVLVFGEIIVNNQRWYRVDISGMERFIPDKVLNCQIKPL